jgi:cell division initiation protein
MELTPQVFRDVQFREKLRGGYHPEDVDEFLEEAAQAAEEAERKLKSALERAERAEQALQEASASNETLRRVLIVAQRTADEAVREAREEAERVVAEARVQAQAIIADAEERGRLAYESKLSEARANLERAEEALKRAQSDAELLTRWVAGNKAQLVQALREAATSLEKLGSAEEPPAVWLPTQEMGPGQPEQVGARQPSAAGDPPGGEAAVTAGTTGRWGVAQGSRAVPVPPGGAPVQREGEETPLSSSGGEWDPSFLEDLDEAVPQAQHAGTVGAGEATAPGVPSPQAGQKASSSADDSTVAFDEEALDSFFRDQDLHVKGPGRFRWRN